MNLLLNGIEATGEGLVTIATQVIYKEDTAHENAVRITIDDNGPGIAQEHLEHIFEPFYTTKKMGKSGTGLGLSVVWNTVEDHGGTIKVTNQDPGVRFEVILPTSTDQVPLKNDTYSYNLGRYQGTGTILVVDDEPHLREIASEIVLELGYSVSAVASGEEALALLKRRPVDLVLLDMILGEGMGGLQTYQKMIALNPLQKAIIVSGYSTSEEVQKTLEMGAFSIIKKPYTLEEIGRAIKECMGNVPTAHN